MGIARSIVFGLRRLLRPGASRRDLDDEVRDYFASATEAYVRTGLSPAEAARQVRVRYGNESVTRDHAASGGWESVVETFWRDVRYAFRGLRKNPAFTAVAVLSLGLGIGATTTMFSVVDAIDFRPLPFKNPDHLVFLAEVTPPNYEMCSRCAYYTSAAMARDWATQTRAFAAEVATATGDFTWNHDDVVESMRGRQASPGFFSVLGVPLLQGREFVAADTTASASPVAIISYEFWQARLGGNPKIVGSTLLASDDRTSSPDPRAVTIIGVLPQHFQFEGSPPVWTPLVINPRATRSRRDIIAIGRLRDGQTLSTATTELQTISARLASEYPDAYRDWGASARPLREFLVWGAGKGRFVLFAITMLVLLIAILNVAGLLFGRAAARQPEFAVRVALGAGRGQLLRQLLVEGACVGIAGGILGVFVTLWAVHVVPAWFGTDDSGLAVAVDHRILLFATALSVAVGLSAAAAPAMRAASADSGRALRSRQGSATAGAARASNVLIALQISLALVLLTAAGLLSRDFLQLRYLDLGFEPRGLYNTSLSEMGRKPVDVVRWAAQAEAARARVAAIPGVTAVSLEYRNAMHPQIVRPDGDQSVAFEPALVKAIDPAYFTTFGMSMIFGRPFATADGPSALRVAIVNKAAAALYWPGQSPLGRRIFVGDSTSPGELLTVVGVAPDAERLERFVRHLPVVYRPFQQAHIYHAAAGLSVRVANETPGVLAAAEQALRQEVGRRVSPFASDEASLGNKLLPQRFNAIALDLFASFGVLLAALGIYGSVSYSVAQRTQEIGIRIALGAERWAVVGLFARRVAMLAIGGVFVGVVAAGVLSRVLRSFLSTTSVTNPWIFAGAIVLMIVVAALATFGPARRAAQVDAVIALRGE